MGLFTGLKKVKDFLFFVVAFTYLTSSIGAETPHSGKILYLIHQGQHKQAIILYRQLYQERGSHDFELIHQIGLGLLDYGHHQPDPETQLLALFGSSVSAHEDAYYILEESLKSSYPQLQLIALQAMVRLQHSLADQALLRAMGSDYLLLRLEALEQLCKKKHVQAVAQTESLALKTPKEMLAIYPQFYAMVGTSDAIRVLRKLLNHSSNDVRIAAILNAAKYGRDDLLPVIRQQAFQLHYGQQEAVAYALGVLKDEKSLSKLEKLASSQYPSVALAACQALYQLGQVNYLIPIQKAAKKGDVFAIQVLGEVPEETATLLELARSSDIQTRLNAVLKLLNYNHPSCASYLKELIIRDKRDLAFTQISSPGSCFKAWKAIFSSSQILKDDLIAYRTNLEFKEELLEKARCLPESSFLEIAEQVFSSHQHLLVPTLVHLLEDLGTPSAVELLIKYQKLPGAPLIRQYCNLALYRLKEPGHYAEELQEWVKTQSQQDLIRFRPFVPWKEGKSHYELTPEETSRLLIEAFEAFASNQDLQGLDSLLQAIENGHKKNKYALAGLLLRATY